MAINSLFPAFVRINYLSSYGVHTMTVPAVDVVLNSPVPSGFAFNLRGAAVDVDVVDAVSDFVDICKPFFRNHVKFVDFTVFTMENPTAQPLPRISRSLTQVGTNVVAGWDKATQMTLTWRTDEFGLFKIVFLDVATGGDFGKVVDLTTAPNMDALSDYVTADVTWVAGRDGGRPVTFLQASTTLNEKLRRSYKLN